jgi:hypothetical protein
MNMPGRLPIGGAIPLWFHSLWLLSGADLTPSQQAEIIARTEERIH